MKEPFFITGLPRSRTAWLSVVLSMDPNCYCVHDVFRCREETDGFLRGVEADVWTAQAMNPEMVCGYSDPALVFHWNLIVEKFPKSKWITIRRPSEEVSVSCERISGFKAGVGFLEKMSKSLSRLASETNTFEADFHSLDGQVPEILNHIGLRPSRWVLGKMCSMTRMNIQVDPAVLRKEMKETIENPPKWMTGIK